MDLHADGFILAYVDTSSCLIVVDGKSDGLGQVDLQDVDYCLSGREPFCCKRWTLFTFFNDDGSSFQIVSTPSLSADVQIGLMMVAGARHWIRVFEDVGRTRSVSASFVSPTFDRALVRWEVTLEID